MTRIFLTLVFCLFSLPSITLGQGSLNILLINDDGIDAEGLQTLKSSLESAGHEVTVVAPNGNASASSSSVNIGETFLIEPYDTGDTIENEYAVSRTTDDQQSIDPVAATPTECIIASAAILESAPDLIISGINDQHNTGRAVQFSGTVGGALSAASKLSPHGVLPSIAVSLEGIFLSDPDESSDEFEKDYDSGSDFVVRLVERLQESAQKFGGVILPEGITLNINYPARPLEGIKGVKYGRQGDSYLVRYDDESGDFPVMSIQSSPLVLSEDASGNIEFESVISIIDANEGVNKSDTEDLVDGYITIVPLDGDNTARPFQRMSVKNRIGNLNSLLDGE